MSWELWMPKHRCGGCVRCEGKSIVKWGGVAQDSDLFPQLITFFRCLLLHARRCLAASGGRRWQPQQNESAATDATE